MEEKYTAYVYEDDGVTIEEDESFSTKEEAISFAEQNHWDGVKNAVTNEVVWEAEKSFTAFVYDEHDHLTIADESQYDDKAEAIAFAKHHDWDGVRDDVSGEIVWSR